MLTMPYVAPPVNRAERVTSPVPDYGLIEAIGHRKPPEGLLDLVLALFRGHPVPALYNFEGYPAGWHPGIRTSRMIAFRAHLVGVARAGSYPFLGTLRGCGCRPREHVCAGAGARYLCLDLDAHNGETDMRSLATRVLTTCYTNGLRPVAFASGSGTGIHVFVFLDGVLPTATVAAAGAALRAAAGAEGRVDVIPSAGHVKGYGTLHALPLGPIDGRRGGGLLLDQQLRPVLEPDRLLERLRRADSERSPARILERLAADPDGARRALAAALVAQAPATPSGSPQTGITWGEFFPAPGAPGSSRRKSPTKKKPTAGAPGGSSDGYLIAAVKAVHPQFRELLEAEPGDGGRSARDAALARMARRQGVGADATARALERLPGSKAADRDERYSRALGSWEPETADEPIPRLPGMPLDAAYHQAPRKVTCTRRLQGKGVHDDRRGAEGPWPDRVAPPAAYDGEPNPWWRPDVQERLAARRSRVEGPMLAFLVGYWFWGRGRHPRRRFFLGLRSIAAALGVSLKAARAGAERLRLDFSDVVRVEAGVPHAVLRIATSFDIVALPGVSRAPTLDNRTDPAYIARASDDPEARADVSDDQQDASVADRDSRSRPFEREPGRSSGAPSGTEGADSLEARVRPVGGGRGDAVLVRGGRLAPPAEGLSPDRRLTVAQLDHYRSLRAPF